VLEGDGGRSVLAIRAGRSRFTLQTLPESDFPDLAAGEDDPHLRAGSLRRQTADRPHAIRDLDRRDALLSQRHLSARGRQRKAATLRAVAPTGIGWRRSICPAERRRRHAGRDVPRKTVGEVQRLIEDNEAEVSIELSQGKIRFTLGNVVLTSKLIDGTFPDYGRVIRKTTTRN